MACRRDRQSRHRVDASEPSRPTPDGSPSRSPGTGCARSASTTRRSRPSRRSFARGSPRAPSCSGITGAGHPEHWDAGLTAPEFHAIVILFARDVAERERCKREHADYLARIGGVRLLSSLDLEALPPYGEPREHFGYLDRLTHPSIEGTNDPPTPGSIRAIKAGEFFLGYADESGETPALPQPEALTRNGSYLAYLRLQEHVGVFREFLRTQGGPTREEQELLAAKLMGRWRSGAPLVLSPEKDDATLGADLQRTNDFNYATMDPRGYALPGRLAHPPHESSRHRRQHGAPPDHPARRDVRAAVARGCRGRRRGSRDRGVHGLREPRSANSSSR